MREIPRPQWPTFLSQFGYRHFGWKVIVEHKLPGREKLIEDHCFLEEIVNQHADGREQIAFVLGTPFRPFRTRIIDNPSHVRVPARREHALKIEAEDGSYTVVRLLHSNRGHLTY